MFGMSGGERFGSKGVLDKAAESINHKRKKTDKLSSFTISPFQKSLFGNINGLQWGGKYLPSI